MPFRSSSFHLFPMIFADRRNRELSLDVRTFLTSMCGHSSSENDCLSSFVFLRISFFTPLKTRRFVAGESWQLLFKRQRILV